LSQGNQSKQTRIKPTTTTDASRRSLLATQEQLDDFVARGGVIEYQQPEVIQNTVFIRTKGSDPRKQKTKGSFLPKLKGE